MTSLSRLRYDCVMPTLTIAEMTAKLNELGLKRKYKPINDSSNVDRSAGDEVILLDVRKPTNIVDGEMNGSEIDIHDNNTVRVWTSRKSKAMAIARAIGCKVRMLDGEAELFLPMSRADEFIHGLGAKVKANRNFTPEQNAAAAARLAKVRAARKAAKATTN